MTARLIPVCRAGDAGRRATRWWKALVERAGVPHRRIHDGRHSVATALLNSGESIPNVSQHLGHSRESITLDVYGHASRDAGTRAAAALDAWVGSARRQEVTGALESAA